MVFYFSEERQVDACHTLHMGETTLEQRFTAHTYKHVILEWIFQTAPLEIRILRLIYREISFKSLYAPIMCQPIAVALCCLRKVWRDFLVRIIVSRSHSGEVYKLVEKFKPPGIVTPAGGSGYKVIISFLRWQRSI